MREYNRRSGGKIILTANIYESEKEYYESHTEPLKRWGDTSIQEGDWVIADDGYVVQCLTSRLYQGQRHLLFYFKFPMGTFCITKSKDKFYIPSFYAQFSKPSLHRIGTANGRDEKTKIRFVAYVMAGFEIGESYKRAYPNGIIGSNTALKKGIELMKDEVVRVEIKNQLDSFVGRLKDKFTEDTLIDELELLLSKSRKGSMAHRQNLELILQLTGYMDNPLSKKKQAEEVNYEEIIPPQLPQ